jgi:hypothetical protein
MLGYTELVSNQDKWIILISILLSEDYTITVDDVWEEKLRKIQRTFPSLRGSNHNISAMEAADLIKDLVYKDKLLEMDGDCDGGTVEFVSDNVRHHVMGYVLLNCLKSDEDYENYINISSVDSLLEFGRTWSYETEEDFCFHVPVRLEDFFFSRLGIDAIKHIMVARSVDLDVDETVLYIRGTVSGMCKYFYLKKIQDVAVMIYLK